MTSPAGTPDQWSGIAAWYDDLLSGGSGPHQHATAVTLRLAGNVGGAVVLDLACGQGMAARALASAGAASVTGVDASPEMVALAEGYEASRPLGIRYVADDAQTLASLEDGSFDLVTCQLGLMDIPDLAAVLAAVARVLRDGGSFVFVIGHPCFLAPEAQTVAGADGQVARLIGDYLTERFWRSSNPQGVRRVGNHHRTLSTYLNALRRAGFVLEESDESPACEVLAAQSPVYVRLPIFFGGRAVKALPWHLPADRLATRSQALRWPAGSSTTRGSREPA
jgi:ubiquinone/menaquinone biosynthesis C-methylase UbiE